MDMFTPLLPEAVPLVDADPMSFCSGGGDQVSSLTRLSTLIPKWPSFNLPTVQSERWLV